MDALLATPDAPRTLSPSRAHCVGLAGAGMRSLATVLAGQGWRITGSDDAECEPELAERFSIARGRRVEHLPADADLVIHSAAVAEDHIELREARRRGLDVVSYGAMLGRLMAGRRGLAVAGTHGKTTTTAMTAEILLAAGLDPTAILGGVPHGWTSGGRAGASDWFLVEACEYRDNFRALQPVAAALLNIEPDHFDCFPTDSALEAAFARFIGRIARGGRLIVSADCAAAGRVGRDAIRSDVELFSFSATNSAADWQIVHPRWEGDAWRFKLASPAGRTGWLRLGAAGKHNLANAVAAAALASAAGATLDDCGAGLAAFRGVRRRLEVAGALGGAAWVDDYAHHPTAISATLAAIRQQFPGGRLSVVFQPHQALRTARLLDDFAGALQNIDRLWVTEIVRARESAWQPGEIAAADLAAAIRRRGGTCEAEQDLPAIADRLTELLDAGEFGPGDVIATLGAGDLRKLGHELIQRVGTIR